MKGEYLKIDTVKTMAELLEENKKLQERIDKSLNYIYELKSNCDERILDKIVEILKGENNGNN